MDVCRVWHFLSLAFAEDERSRPPPRPPRSLLVLLPVADLVDLVSACAAAAAALQGPPPDRKSKCTADMSSIILGARLEGAAPRREDNRGEGSILKQVFYVLCTNRSWY